MAKLTVKIAKRTDEAIGIVSFELVDPAGKELPCFTAGDHIDVHCNSGRVRQYSLFNSCTERYRYCIAVLELVDGRGGSSHMHTLQEGDLLEISAPRNAFKLVESGTYSLLLAGGIGITPLLSMAWHLWNTGQRFDFHYFARTQKRAAFCEQLRGAPFAAHMHFHFDDEPANFQVDLDALLANSWTPGTHLYVCGPSGFMDRAVGVATDCWPDDAVHTERFDASAQFSEAAIQNNQPFQIILASSGATLEVPSNSSILRVLQANGINVPMSCEQGVCGTCLVDVIEGKPEHRDSFQTKEEHSTNRQIAVCCSRSCSPVLKLNL